ncbi:spore gernimation protein GerPD [Bacillaceae bacterium W0354]
MKVTIHNDYLNVDHIQITGVSASSLFIVGDTEHLQLASSFDTPPESYIFQNIFPNGTITGEQ